MSSDSVRVKLQEALYNSRNPTRRWLHRSRRDWIVDALRSAACNGAGRTYAVEIGPGSGVYLPLLADLYREVIATEAGLRLERWVESKVRNSPLAWLLWTQYYIASV
jgi:hypothetical protein